MFFWNSLAFSMIQRMLAIWSLVLLYFLKPAWTSGISQFTYCWSLAWRILSITLLASGGGGILVELFQILKDDTVKACQQIWKTQQWPQDSKRPVFIPIPKIGNAKECSNYHTVALISHASKEMLKNSPSQVSIICELWSSRYLSWF